MMELPVVYIWTHDSISLGEDGPTHQPVEQLAALRAMPGMIVMRPADANEVVEAWRVIMACRDRPISLVLTRQAVPTFDRSRCAAAAGLACGAYVLADAPDQQPEVLLLGTGSEVALCLAAYEQLKAEGVHARVVSMPSWELFEQQSTGIPRTACCRRQSGRGWRWNRHPASAGSGMPGRTARCWRCTPSACRRPGRSSPAISASRRSTWCRRHTPKSSE